MTGGDARGAVPRCPGPHPTPDMPLTVILDHSFCSVKGYERSVREWHDEVVVSTRAKAERACQPARSAAKGPSGRAGDGGSWPFVLRPNHLAEGSIGSRSTKATPRRLVGRCQHRPTLRHSHRARGEPDPGSLQYSHHCSFALPSRQTGPCRFRQVQTFLGVTSPSAAHPRVGVRRMDAAGPGWRVTGRPKTAGWWRRNRPRRRTSPHCAPQGRHPSEGPRGRAPPEQSRNRRSHVERPAGGAALETAAPERA